MPCISLKHVIATNTREKRIRAAYKERQKRLKMAQKSAQITEKAQKSPKTVTKPVQTRPSAPISTKTNQKVDKISTYADMINAESKLGSTLFGPIPDGHRREFFHDRKNIWIWHEDWTDEAKKEHEMTIRYEVLPTGVYKKVAAGSYFKLEGEELENFRSAAHAYLDLIKNKLYNNPALFA